MANSETTVGEGLNNDSASSASDSTIIPPKPTEAPTNHNVDGDSNGGNDSRTI